MSATSVMVGLAIASATCTTQRAPRCFGAFCVLLPVGGEVREVNRRVTVRIPSAQGWIDVQRFRAPDLNDEEDAARVLARRHELSGVATVHATRSSRLGARLAWLEIATLRWRGREYTRHTYLTRSAGEWFAVDETAPTEVFATAAPALDAVLATASWRIE